MPDSPEDNSPLTWRSSTSVTDSGGRGQLTREGLTSDTRPRQQESTSVAPPKRTPPREQSTKKAKRPDQQLYVPRRGRQTSRTSSESPQSVKQSIDTKQPDYKDGQNSEQPVVDLGDSCQQTDHNTNASPRQLEADTIQSSKAPSFQDQNSLSTKQGNPAVDDQPNIERNIDQCSLSFCETTSADSENIGLNRQTDRPAKQYRESQCNVPLSEKVTQCGIQIGNSANDFVLESNTNCVSEKVAIINTCTPALEQPQELVCDSALKDTHKSRSESQIAAGKLQSESFKVVAVQDQSPLPTEIIMAEDASRLESTGVSGSIGDDVTARGTSGSGDKGSEEARLDGGEKDDDGRKEADEGGEDEEEDSWDTMFDEEGNSLKEDEIKEITDAVGGMSVSVKKPAHDYLNFSPKDNTDYSKLEHVIEVFDFPADFKTEDLVMSFSAFKNKGYDITWVDETHALVVFATSQVATDALGLQNPMLRTRPLSLASKQTKQKAKSTVEFIQPYRPRPETSSLAARRMVSNALGVKSNVSKEQRAAEKQKLKEAKERKRDEKRQKSDIWDGNI